MNEGDQETSGTSFNRLRTCVKQRNQLLIITLRLQNLHITEYKGKRFFPRCKGFHAVVHKATKNIDWQSFFIRVSVGFYYF